ncbi:bacteriocin [Paenibacillus sp. GCM10027628]
MNDLTQELSKEEMKNVQGGIKVRELNAAQAKEEGNLFFY